MAVKPKPDAYHSVTPYLVVPGVAKLIEFMRHAFGATETERMSRQDGRIMHAEVKIGDSVIMMGEPMGDWQPMPAMLYVYVSNTDAVYKHAIQAGATSLMEPADQFYGDRNGTVKDSFGNIWCIATHVEDVSREELMRRAEAYGRK